MIEWCNNNSGFAMTMLTLIYVVANVIIVTLMVKANRLTARSTAIAAHLDKERSKPNIVMEIVPDIPFFRLKVRNLGYTTAHKVRFEVLPEPKLCFGGKNQNPAEKTEKTIGFISNGIASLSPQGELSTTLGTYDRLKESLGSPHIRGRVLYDDTLGDAHESVVDIDLSMYEGLAYSGKKTIDTVAKELEKIRQEIAHLGSGFHKIHVLTQRVKDYQEEQEKLVKEAGSQEQKSDDAKHAP